MFFAQQTREIAEQVAKQLADGSGINNIWDKGIAVGMLSVMVLFIYFLTKMHREQQKEERQIFTAALEKQKIEDRAERAEDRTIFRQSLASTNEKFAEAVEVITAQQAEERKTFANRENNMLTRIDRLEGIIPNACQASKLIERK